MLLKQIRQAVDACFSPGQTSTSALDLLVGVYARIQRLMGQVTLRHLGLSADVVAQTPDRAIRYQHVYESRTFTMGVFIFGRGATLPLHDHPDMLVLSHVVTGEVHWQSYDWVASSPKATPGRGRLARKTSDSRLHAPCDVLLASPTANNLHAFEAIQPAVLLDILAPPYEDEAGRSCTYYRVGGDDGSPTASTNGLVSLVPFDAVVDVDSQIYLGEAA